MKLITKLTLSAALVAGFTAAPAMAGPLDIVKDAAKAEAKKEAKKQAKDMAIEKAQSMTGVSDSTVDLAEKALDVTGVVKAEPEDTSLLGKATDLAKDKVNIGGGSTGILGSGASSLLGGTSLKDQAIGMAKDKAMGMAKDQVNIGTHDGNKMETMKDKMMSHPGGDKVIQKGGPAMAEPAQAAPTLPTNCPSGTTGQPDGTCMITGDYGS